VTLNVESAVRSWPTSARFRVQAGSGCKVMTGDRVSVPGPGGHRHTVEVQGVVNETARAVPVSFQVVPEANQTFEFSPAAVKHEGQVPAPPPAELALRAKVLAVGPARWVGMRGKARFNARIEVLVEGQFKATTVFGVLATAPVRRVKLTPSTIQTGRQVVEAVIDADLPPAPGRATLHLRIQPPSQRPGIRIAVKGDLELTVPGPRPLTAGLAFGDRVPPLHTLSVADPWAAQVPVVTVPRASGGKTADGVPVKIQVSGDLDLDSESDLVVGRPAKLVLRPRKPSSPWQWRDTVYVATVTTTAEQPAFAASTQQIAVHVPSALKRLALILAIVLGALLGVGLMARMVTRMRKYEPPQT